MLMANSVEGRFPFLDREVLQLAASLPASYKLHVLDEKHVLKRAARDLIPASILRRPKQPYRAPDTLSFVLKDAPPWVEDVMTERSLRETAVFDPKAVRSLWQKCLARAASGQFSNTDNMAVVAVLSTQLLHRQLVAKVPNCEASVPFRTMVES
jgi:asparagine synthase (glutamine-hydrolysing)